ncbi:hypothetical protein MTQ99_27145, partial [Burkholderia thailandensis]
AAKRIRNPFKQRPGHQSEALFNSLLDERDALRHEKHRRLLSAMRAARRASKRRASRADRPSRIGKFRSRSASARRIGDAEQSIGTHFESTSRNATSGHFIERSAQC